MRKRSRLDRIKESLRLQQVYNVLLHYGLDMVFDRGFIGDFRQFMQDWIYDIPEPAKPLTSPVKGRLLLQELGPTYVKMGQIISSRATVLPAEWEAELVKLQSDVPSFPTEVAYEIIEEELGKPVNELFATFNNEPLAAASTAQVHRATLHDGTEVAVKVQRPDIRSQMKSDIGIMYNASRVLVRRVDWAKNINLGGMLNEFGENIIDELDYRGEAYNGIRLKRGLEPIEGVSVPDIYQEYSTSKVLTMDFIKGVKLTNLEAIKAAGLDTEALALTSLRAMLKQMLIDGFFHADPHPGNLILNLDTNTIYFIDLGMVGELTAQSRLSLINMLVVLQQQDAHGLAQVVLGICTPFREFDEKAYYRDFERTVSRQLEFGSEFSDSITAAFDVLERNGLRMDADLTMAIKAMTQAEAIAMTLSPGASFVEIGRQVLQELAVKEVTAEKITATLKKEATNTLRELSKQMPSLQEATLSWLGQYKKGRFEVHINSSQLDKQVEDIRGIAWYFVIGIMLVGMIIGSSIAINVIVSTGSEFSGLMTNIAYAGYVGSMVIATVVVLLLLWRLIKGAFRYEDE